MDINIKASLFPPGSEMYIGGENQIVFHKKVVVTLIPQCLKDLLSKSSITLPPDETCKVESYDSVSNTLSVTGYMRSIERDYIYLLMQEGWSPDLAGAAHYHIVIPLI